MRAMQEGGEAMKDRAWAIAFTAIFSFWIGAAVMVVGQRLGVNSIVLFVLVLLAGVSSAQIISKKLEGE